MFNYLFTSNSSNTHRSFRKWYILETMAWLFNHRSPINKKWQLLRLNLYLFRSAASKLDFTLLWILYATEIIPLCESTEYRWPVFHQVYTVYQNLYIVAGKRCVSLNVKSILVVRKIKEIRSLESFYYKLPPDSCNTVNDGCWGGKWMTSC